MYWFWIDGRSSEVSWFIWNSSLPKPGGGTDCCTGASNFDDIDYRMFSNIQVAKNSYGLSINMFSKYRFSFLEQTRDIRIILIAHYDILQHRYILVRM